MTRRETPGRCCPDAAEIVADLIDFLARRAVHLRMEDRRRLQHDLERYTALLPLTTDPQAIAVLEELIRETRTRLDELDAEITSQNVESAPSSSFPPKDQR
jgi:hypothetical protein